MGILKLDVKLDLKILDHFTYNYLIVSIRYRLIKETIYMHNIVKAMVIVICKFSFAHFHYLKGKSCDGHVMVSLISYRYT